jgi:DNA-directed RNA polymerase sigma subunit (sigma70/sigma32)
MDKEAKQYLARQRYMDASRWRETGWTYSRIAKRFGVSIERARQMVAKGDRLKMRGKDKSAQSCRDFAMHLKHIWPIQNAER